MRLGWRLVLLLLAILILILVPFVLWGDSLDALTERILSSPKNRLVASLCLAALLSLDAFLPVPSSLVSTALGSLIGLVPGTLLSFVAMTLSCAIGYWTARGLGPSLTASWIREKDRKVLKRMNERWGDWGVVVARPVPVLAEAATWLAGLTPMGFARFSLLTGLANLGISLIYASAGSAAQGSFLLAFLASLILPGLLLMIWKRPTPE